jgi:phenylalanyl-tRNA synthetase beta subunit
MKCEKSYKRTILKTWGIKQLESRSWEEVTQDMNRMRHWTLQHLLEFVNTNNKEVSPNEE